jgi:AAA15 family ATPase/GTPase
MPDNEDYLANLKKINIFVGANNSGKSRFLRAIFQAENDSFVFFENFNIKLKEIFVKLEPRFQTHYAMADLQSLMNYRTGDYIANFNRFYDKIDQIKNESSSIRSLNVSDLGVANAIRWEMQELGIYEKIDIDYDLNIQHIYVPMLRGLRHIDIVNERGNQVDLYKMKTEKDYEFKLPSNRSIFSGLNVYEEVKQMLLGPREGRELISEFEKFLSESFFNNSKITLISDYHTDNIKINFNNNENDRDIFNVGDGIQSIIIAVFEAFKHKNENLVLFLEEPELTLHPSAQRILIETLIAKFSKLQIFLTTHSNHFLDLTYDYPNDVSIFSFEEKGSEKFYINDVGGNSKILDLLGIRNSSVFLSNCVIWTEGVTDRMFLRKLFEIKNNFGFKEDFHYTFAEYGGGNMENFDFVNSENGENKVNVSSLSKVNYIIADNDDIRDSTKSSVQKNPKYIRRQKIRSILGDKSFFDSHIEIENLIPFKIWVDAIGKLLKNEPTKKIKLKNGFETMEKKFNSDLNRSKIGTILKKYLIEKQNPLDKLKYYDNNSNIQCLGSSKKKIMEYIIGSIDKLGLSLDEFPIVTQDLINALNEFIKAANK